MLAYETTFSPLLLLFSMGEDEGRKSSPEALSLSASTLFNVQVSFFSLLIHHCTHLAHCLVWQKTSFRHEAINNEASTWRPKNQHKHAKGQKEPLFVREARQL